MTPEQKGDAVKQIRIYQMLVGTLLTATLLVSCGQAVTPAADPRLGSAYTGYFAEADADRSGTLEPSEISASIGRVFDTLDTTDDGVVTLDDIYNAEQGHPAGAERNTDLSSHLPYDADRNGVITREEHQAYAAALIRRMDANKDGHITFAEYRASKEF